MATDLVFAIESLGVTASRRVYFFARGQAPSWDSDNAWVESCWMGWPGEVASAISFGDGSSSIGGMTLDVNAQALTQQGSTVASMLYNQTRVSVASLVAPAINTTDQTIVLDSTSLAGSMVVIGRECIKMGTHAGGGTYNTCLRGQLSTMAQTHGVAETDYKAVFDATKGPILRWRRVYLYRVDLEAETSYADLELLWSGVIYGVTAPVPNQIRIEADAMISVMERMSICNNLWRGRVRQSQSSENQPSESRAYLAHGPITGLDGTADDALFSVDGDMVIDTNPDDFGSQYTVRIKDQHIYRVLDSGDAVQTLPDSPKEIWQMHHASANSAASTSSLPFSSNLLTLMIQLLTTTAVSGDNGAYDVGVADLGLAIPQGSVDIAGITRVRASFGELLDQELLLLGLDGDPVDVLTYLQAKLLPYGIVICDQSGTIGVAVLSDNDPGAPTLTQASGDILGPASTPSRSAPSQIRRMDLSTDAYSASFRAVPGVEPVTDTFTDTTRRQINIYGDRQAPELDMLGVKERSLVARVVTGLIQRLHEDIPQISLSVLRTRTDITLGSLIAVTHDKIYNPTGGTRGVTDELMLCIERTLHLDSNTLDLVLLDVGALYTRSGVIAPSCVVDSWSDPTLTVEADYAAGGFQSNSINSATPNDTSAFLAADIVQHCDQYGVKIQQLTVATIPTATTMTFTSTPSPSPAAGDILRMEAYTSCVARQTDKFAFLADSSGTLGSDAGKEWTFP